ncbi:MAG: hypothetical protein KC619_30835, partial [Myxococcales bacterium]|nr:hypothetical protein [Myxococcales bacterium]
MRRAHLLLALALASCGPVRPPSDPEAPRQVTGQIVYESRHPTVQGASAEIEVRPARSVDVALLAGGEVVAEGRADAEGRFTIEGPARADTVRVYARTRVRG